MSTTSIPEIKQSGLTIEADREEVALALKTWRLRHDLTQEAVAQRWGMSRYTILRAERAKPISWTMAYKIWARLAAELSKEQRV